MFSESETAEIMDQDRRDAAAWAKEWAIRKKNRRLLYVIAGILLVALIGYAIHVIIVHAERSTFSSEEEMRAAMQGRYARENDYTDIMIEGDNITKTYLAYTHYNREYAERNGYDYNEKDAVYEDRVLEWDYRNGVIKTEWMGDYVVDKDGNIHSDNDSFSYSYYIFYKTDEPRPDPIDPSTLNSTDGDINADLSEDELEILEEREESIEETEDAAEDAGVMGENNVDA